MDGVGTNRWKTVAADGSTRVQPRERRATEQDLILHWHTAPLEQFITQFLHSDATRERETLMSSRDSSRSCQTQQAF